MKGNQISPEVASVYGNRVRIRVCGLHWEGERILLVNHRLSATHDFWSPPGGGLEFGSDAYDNLRREFLEETGLQVTPGRFLFATEFLQAPLHAVELFFAIERAEGALQVGSDPELPVIKDVRFFSESEIRDLPDGSVHGIFKKAKNRRELEKMGGFYRI